MLRRSRDRRPRDLCRPGASEAARPACGRRPGTGPWGSGVERRTRGGVCDERRLVPVPRWCDCACDLARRRRHAEWSPVHRSRGMGPARSIVIATIFVNRSNPNFGNGECRDREIGEERDLRADVYQRASALSLAIALVSVVLAAFFAAPVTGSSLTPSPIIDNSARAVLIRTMTASERVAFANSGVIPIVDYGAFVLATVSGQASAALQSKGMILRTLTDRSTLYLGSVSFDTAKAAPAIADNLRIASYPAGTAGLYLVQFKGPILSSWLDGLRAQGVRVYNYIPNFAFACSGVICTTKAKLGM